MTKQISIFGEGYNDLISYCKAIIHKHKFPLSPEDLISEAYVQFHDTDCTKKDVHAYLLGIVFKEKGHQERTVGIDDRFQAHNLPRLDDVKRCKKCGEILPIAAFRTKDYYSNYACRSCESKMAYAWKCKKLGRIPGSYKKRESKIFNKEQQVFLINQKHCTQCGETKPINDFYKLKRGSKAELSHNCKECEKANRRKKRAEKQAATSRAGQLAAALNIAKSYQSFFEWNAGAQATVKVIVRQRKVKAKRAIRHIPAGVRNEVKKQTKCFYCNTYYRLTTEHLIPVSKGGSNEIGNLTRACRRCNGMRGNLEFNEFFLLVLNKRKEVYDSGIHYINRARHLKQIVAPQSKILNHLNKQIKKCYGEHKYFTRIINNAYRKGAQKAA